MLPNGWTQAQVAELVGPSGLVSDGDWVESKDQDAQGTVRLTQLADIGIGEFRDRSARFMTSEAAERLKCTYLRAGDVLIARMPDPIGRACVFPGLDQPAVTAVDVMIWRTDGSLASADWFVKWINSPGIRTLMLAGAGGTTRQRISGGRIKELRLPLPPLAEQARIVAKLDALAVRLTRARADLARVQALAIQLRSTALTHAFENASSRQATVSSIVSDVRYGTAKKCGYGLGRTSVLRIPNVSAGNIDLSDLKSADFDEREISKLAVLPGDVLVIRSNGSVSLVGRSAVVQETARGMLYAGYLIRLRLKTELCLPEYLHLFMQSRLARQAIEVAARSTSGVHNINAEQLRSLTLPLPDIDVQKTIVTQVHAAFARADRLEADATRAKSLLDRLEVGVISRAFRGELVPQDPADEHADILLDRVRTKRAAMPKSKRGVIAINN